MDNPLWTLNKEFFGFQLISKEEIKVFNLLLFLPSFYLEGVHVCVHMYFLNEQRESTYIYIMTWKT